MVIFVSCLFFLSCTSFLFCQKQFVLTVKSKSTNFLWNGLFVLVWYIFSGVDCFLRCLCGTPLLLHNRASFFHIIFSFSCRYTPFILSCRYLSFVRFCPCVSFFLLIMIFGCSPNRVLDWVLRCGIFLWLCMCVRVLLVCDLLCSLICYVVVFQLFVVLYFNMFVLFVHFSSVSRLFSSIFCFYFCSHQCTLVTLPYILVFEF